MPRRPLGSVVAFRPDFRPYNMMANWMSHTSSGGNLCYVELYNNDLNGRYIYVYNLNLVVGGGDESVFETYQNKYQNIAPLKPSAPLLAGGQISSGEFGAFENPSCIGTHIGGTGNVSSATWSWPHEWPLAILPPGWSFAVQSGQGNAYMAVAMWWLVDNPP